MSSIRTAAAAAIALTAAGCGTAATTTTSAAGFTTAASATHAAAGSIGSGNPAKCAASALALQPGAGVVPMTGEHAVLYALTNRGTVTCTVRGYPQVALYGANGAALPFHYNDGGGQYVTSAKPTTVVLAPGASGYVLVAKYRCDTGIVANATTVRLTLPTTSGGSFSAREAVGVSGSAGLSYCSGGKQDPGQQVTISPVEPTPQAASNLG